MINRVTTRRLVGAALWLGIAGMGPVASAQAQSNIMPVFEVTNTSDGGSGSLRDAITGSNAVSPGPSAITFNIPGSGVQEISPHSALPTITGSVIIDGTSQPGYTGTPLIQLDGASAGSGVSGLTVSAGSSTIKGLEITDFSGTGIVLKTNGSDTLTSDYIGTDGVSAHGNTIGVSASSAGNTIGGTESGTGNVISGNSAFGVSISGQAATANVVEGNFIGTDSSGTSALANSLEGVFVSGKAASNVIGGTAAGSRNVISGNGGDGVDIAGAGTSSNKVQGNYVGIDTSGTAALGNGNEGVAVYGGATKNTVGGTSISARNVVSGNLHDGVAVNAKGTSGNRVEGNYIGLNATGTATLGNGGIGAPVYGGATGNIIGGTTPTSRNVISGNANYGVTLVNTGTSGNLVEGNYIGTNPAGTAALPNAHGGVFLYLGSTRNTVGGTTGAARNVISGNGGSGVGLEGKGTSGNVIEGNFIGTNAAGTGALGNSLDGVRIDTGAIANTIGGTVAGSGNRIAYNHSDGVQVVGASTHGERVERNSIYANLTKVGIALTSKGNAAQPAPVIEKVTETSSATKLQFKVQGPAKYRIEFFANPSCSDPEGKTFLNVAQVTAGTYSVTLSSRLPAGEGVTATATNLSTANTSQFSGCKLVP
jgi:titin